MTFMVKATHLPIQLILLVGCLPSIPGFSQVDLDLVVDAAQARPGDGTFGAFRHLATHGRDILFSTPSSASSMLGLYRISSGQIVTIADSNTPVPGSGGRFTAFRDPKFLNDDVVFIGQSALGDGLYFFDGSSLSVFADRQTPLPNGTVGFGSIASLVTHGDRIAFIGTELMDSRPLHDGSSPPRSRPARPAEALARSSTSCIACSGPFPH